MMWHVLWMPGQERTTMFQRNSLTTFKFNTSLFLPSSEITSQSHADNGAAQWWGVGRPCRRCEQSQRIYKCQYLDAMSCLRFFTRPNALCSRSSTTIWMMIKPEWNRWWWHADSHMDKHAHIRSDCSDSNQPLALRKINNAIYAQPRLALYTQNVCNFFPIVNIRIRKLTRQIQTSKRQRVTWTTWSPCR